MPLPLPVDTETFMQWLSWAIADAGCDGTVLAVSRVLNGTTIDVKLADCSEYEITVGRY